MGNLTLPGWGGVGNLNRKCEFQNIFFGRRLSNARGCFRTWSHLLKRKKSIYRFCEEMAYVKGADKALYSFFVLNMSNFQKL